MVIGEWVSHFMGETIPKITNYVKLDETLKDQWGVPQVRINVAMDDNDAKMAKDFREQLTEMYTLAGFTNIKASGRNGWNPGLDIHEMGACDNGQRPKTSQLNEWNQLHHCKNVFCDRWSLHDKQFNTKPFSYIHGIDSPERLIMRWEEFSEGEFVKSILKTSKIDSV